MTEENTPKQAQSASKFKARCSTIGFNDKASGRRSITRAG
jgi:hypothetical protein